MIHGSRSLRSTRHARLAPAGARRRRMMGFSLVEVIFAIALFGVSMSAIGAFMLTVARQTRNNWGDAQRTAAAVARVNDLAIVPFANLNARAGCTAFTAQPFPRSECIVITDLSATRKRVRITVTPTNTAIDPVSVQFEQTKPPATNPFHVQP
jgi:prepilin-type N-terminal cleavage/methylation domain-containing protein